MSGNITIVSETIVTGPTFSDGAILTGTWVDTFNSGGTLTSVSDVDLTLSGTYQGTLESTTFTAGAAAAPAGVSADTLNSTNFLQVHFASGTGTAPGYSNLYLDFNAISPSSLATGRSNGGEQYTSVHDGAVNKTESLSNGGVITGTETITCFLAGTRILTATGETVVESLKAGDLVRTASGAAKPVRWLGRSTVSTRFADALRVAPIRIKAGALAENIPARDLLVSPDHAMFIGNVLIQAGALVNGISIIRESNLPETLVYYHVELASHELLLAEGAATESFVDNVERTSFDNWAERETPAAIAEMGFPRARSCRQIPSAIHSALAARAEIFAADTAAAA